MQISDFIKEIHFKDTKELFSELSPFGSYSHVLENFIFRGESSNKYKLLPSALRIENKDNLYALSSIGKPIGNQDELEGFQQRAEFELLKRFYTLADERGMVLPDIPFIRDNVLSLSQFIRENQISNEWIATDLLEIAALAQHYGIPTRLLDWSLSHMVSLYFAASGVLHKAKVDNEDSMVIWALNYSLIEFLKETDSKIPIRIIKPTYQRNPNLFSQKGVLTCWEYKNYLASDSLPLLLQGMNTFVNRTPLNELISNYVLENKIDLGLSDGSYSVLLYKMHLPVTEAGTLYKALTALGYGADNIFSGLNGISQRIKDDGLIS